MSDEQWRISVWLLLLIINITLISGVTYDLSSGGYTSIPSGIGTDATTIDLSQNSLTSIASSEFAAYTSLIVIVLSNNSITTIATDAFNGLTTVQELYLDGNELTTYPDLETDLINSLLILDLSRNNISYIPGDVYYLRLEDLSLAKNPIDWTDGSLDGVVAYSGSLLNLDVSSTQCTGTGLVPGNFTHYFEVIVKFIVNRCRPTAMVEVPVLSPWISSIHDISFKHNQLTTNAIEAWSSMGGLSEIFYFDLTRNIMTAIPDLPTALRSTIIELRLGNNLITSIDWTLLANFTALESLNLRNNYLTSISGSVPLVSLTDLYLQGNDITDITEDIFMDASALETLDLRSNDLITLINISSIVTSSYLTINLESNPLVCDCNFSFILEASDAYLLYTNVRTTLNNTPCASPAVFTSADFGTLTTEEICVECQPFPTWLDVELDDGEVIELGGEIRYVCSSGYDFGDNDRRKTSTCSVADGEWSSRIETCYEPTIASSIYEDTKEAKNAKVIGSLAIILVSCEIAFMLLLDTQHLKVAYLRFKKNFCDKGDKEDHKHGNKRGSSVQPDSTFLDVPSVQDPMTNHNGSRASFSSRRSHRSSSVHGSNISFA